MSAETLVQTLRRFRDKRLLVDTNLLLLYFVGGVRRDLIKSFKRTASFGERDFILLARIIHFFRRVATTPHVLTEVSNLLSQRGEPERSALLRFVANSIQRWREHSPPSRQLVQRDCFLRFGLTDTAITEVSLLSCLVLTDDRALAGFLTKRGGEVLCFQDLQAACL